MAASSTTLGEPLVQGEGPSRARSVGKVVALISLLTGLCCAALWGHGEYVQQIEHHSDLDEAILAKIGVSAMAGRHVQLFPPPSSSPRGGMAQVQAMQDTLKKYGVPSSPMQKLALTQLAATRDPSMRAQVREVFSEVDPATQDKVRRVSKEVIARAEATDRYPRETPDLVEDRSGIIAFESPENLAKMAGQIKPLMFWDPLKLSEGAVNLPEGRLYFYREAELKNGRVAMLAVLGILVGSQFHPFYEGATPYTSPVASHFTAAMAKNFWPSLGMACGLAELFSYPDKSKPPGDLGFDPLGLKPTDEKAYLELQNKELANGRLAMMAYAGLIGKELLTGEKVF